MRERTVLFLLMLCIILCIVLLAVVFYQRFVFPAGIRRKLREINDKLREISDTDSDEHIMVFTENRELMELAAQINRLLEDRLKMKADYRRSQMASKKMLSNISHDIKTPMTVILGYLEIMRLHGEPAGEMLEMLQKTERKAKNVMDLINQFFTLAKLEAGDTDIVLSRIDVCEVCRESILDFYGILSSGGFQVEVDVPEDAVYAQGNEEALQRILYNLLSNVVRYGADGKYLGIFLRTDEKSVYIDVTDKGKGIDKPFADSVFDRLFTMEDSRSRKVQGNGLGLTIVKSLVAELGGSIRLDSTPYEKTTFTVKLKRIIY